MQANRTTEGAFLNVPLSLAASGGFLSQRQNAADVEANTTEFALQTRVIDRPNLSWSLGVTGDHTTQKITRLGRAPFRVNAGGQGQDVFYYKEGEALGVIYGQHWVRDLSELADNPAGLDPSLYSKNALGYVVLTANKGTPNERPVLYVDPDNNTTVRIGDVNPDFTLGITNNVQWKGFAVYALLDIQKGGNVYNFTKQWMFQDFRAGDLDQGGVAAADKIAMPFFSTGLYNGLVANDHFVEDASYMKVRELSVSYTLSQQMINKLQLGGRASSVKVALIGRNLKTWTSYSGFDPDVASGGDFNFRIDGFRYPSFRTVTAQVAVTF